MGDQGLGTMDVVGANIGPALTADEWEVLSRATVFNRGLVAEMRLMIYRLAIEVKKAREVVGDKAVSVEMPTEWSYAGQMDTGGVLSAADDKVLMRTIVYKNGLVDDMRRIIYRLALEVKALRA